MEKLAKYTTIIYALLWFLGFILSYSYYSLFNIDIVEYLDFTEIFFGFFTNILEVQYSGQIIFFYVNLFIPLFYYISGRKEYEDNSYPFNSCYISNVIYNSFGFSYQSRI